MLQWFFFILEPSVFIPKGGGGILEPSNLRVYFLEGETSTAMYHWRGQVLPSRVARAHAGSVFIWRENNAEIMHFDRLGYQICKCVIDR